MKHTTFRTSIAILTLAAAATAQWSQTTTATTPAARSQAAMCFDSTVGQVLMFGGSPSFPAGPLNDTWSFNGTNWTLLQPTASPTGRAQCGMVHDLARGVTVLYGGGNTSFMGGPSIDQTWEFNGVTWSQITTVTTPGGLANMGAAYDLIRGKTVIYGGDPNSFFPIASNQTWEYNGLDWTLVTTVNSPGPIERPGMCFDVQLQKVVLFGGIDPQTGGTDDTWAYDGVNWSVLPVTGARPAVRTFCQMVYDQGRGVCVLYGGMDPNNGAPINDTWEFDGTTWTQVSVANPPARSGGSMAFLPSNNRAVMFGGEISFNPVAETWQYGASYETFGAGCTGSNGIPALSATGTPHVGHTLTVDLANLAVASPFAVMFTGLSNTTWNGAPLPADLTPFGLAGCSALISLDAFSLVASSAGNAQFQLAVPALAPLVGVRFYNQGMSFDLAANAAGLTLSNAGAGTIGN